MVRVGIYTFELYLPASNSLKDKRKILKSLKDRLRTRHNISIAEVDGQELWQRSTLAVVSVSNKETVLQASFQKIHNEIEQRLPGGIIAEQVEFL
jgi:uncharacterized protein YlxP (DUF503 family)